MKYPVIGHYASHGSCSNCGKQNTDNSQWALYCVSCIESVYDPPKTAIAEESNSSELICANCIRLFAEKTALQHDIARHVAICADQATENERLVRERDALREMVKEECEENFRLRAENERLRTALIRLRDCDWTITLPDRMDAVREIARKALAAGGE